MSVPSWIRKWAILTGKDGKVSFSKFILLWIMVLVSAGRAPSDFCVALLIAASHGTKVLLEWIQRTKLERTETATTAVTSNTTSNTTHTIAEQVQRTIVATRDPATGESTPATPGQRLEDVREARTHAEIIAAIAAA